MIVETVPAALAGERLDRVVALVLDVSRSVAAAVIDSGGAAVDGEVCTIGKMRLTEGQEVAVDPGAVPEAGLPQPDPAVTFGVVHEDDAVIVIDKPAGLVVHPGAGNADGTLVNGLLARYPDLVGVGEDHRPGIVHRLDAGSSGLLVVARTQHAADALIEQFASHAADPGVLRARVGPPRGATRRDRRADRPVAAGSAARWPWSPTAAPRAPSTACSSGSTARPSWPSSSAGSRRDGPTRSESTSARSTTRSSAIRSTGSARPKLQVERPFLHAAELAFVHPATGERVTFHSELPADLAGRLATLHHMVED